MKRLIYSAILIIYLFSAFVQHYANADGVGTIEIPSINCKFDLSYSGRQLNAHQHIALLFKQQGAICVGNHYGSASPTGGAWKLENLRVGDKAYLDYITMDGLEVVHHTGNYVCYAVMICDVNGNTLSRNGQELVFAKTDLVCVTCVGSDSKHNYGAVFEKVS